MGPSTCFWRSDAAPGRPPTGESTAERCPEAGLHQVCPEEPWGPGSHTLHPSHPWGHSLYLGLQLSFLLPNPNNKWIQDDKRREKNILFLLGQTIVGF